VLKVEGLLTSSSFSGMKINLNFDSLALKNLKTKAGAVVHACNPSYSRDGDQENPSSEPVWTKDHQTPSQPIKTWTWRCKPVIPVMWKA
jgi:hypothetical protein